MSTNRHQLVEELISASLTGDLTDAEREQLDAHLDGCTTCRATLASFSEQRRIMAGLRHVAAPRDLGARVRAGVERGAFAHVPWWRRPALLFAGLGGGLAAVAGALLALVLLNGVPDDQVGAPTDSPAASATVAVSASPRPTVQPTPVASATLTASPAPSDAPAELTPEPDVFLAYTGEFDNLALTVSDGRLGQSRGEVAAQGAPIAAALSPNGQFLAFITERGQSGMNEVWVTHVPRAPGNEGLRDATGLPTELAEWEVAELGESLAGTEFLEQLTWAADSRFLGYTLADPSGAGTDAWVFDATTGATQRFTETGTGYAAGWSPGVAGDPAIWISFAGERPTSELVEVDEAGLPAGTTARADVFQPLISPDQSRVVYWRGVMAPLAQGWVFAEGGSPYIAGVEGSDSAIEFVDERQLFSDVTIDRDAFVSAGLTWGADSDAYAVWGAEWAGVAQASGEYPDVDRVYFGHATDDRELTANHAIDERDLPEGAPVVDVKVTTPRHLVITVRVPIAGTLDAPRARLLLVTRNTGSVPDEVMEMGDPDRGWYGPAAHDAYEVVTAP